MNYLLNVTCNILQCRHKISMFTILVIINTACTILFTTRITLMYMIFCRKCYSIAKVIHSSLKSQILVLALHSLLKVNWSQLMLKQLLWVSISVDFIYKMLSSFSQQPSYFFYILYVGATWEDSINQLLKSFRCLGTLLDPQDVILALVLSK